MAQEKCTEQSSIVELITKLDIQSVKIEGYDELAHRVTIALNLVDDIDEIDQLTKALKITNAEKYAEQIALLIAEDPGADTCTRFGASVGFYGDLNCDTCPINKICNNPKELKEWLVGRYKA